MVNTMEMFGRIKDFKRDVFGKNHVLTLQVEDPQQVEQNYDILKDKRLQINIDEWYRKRGLTANGLFHKLVQNIADKSNKSLTYVKNDLVTSYGQIDIEDGDVVYIESNNPPQKMYEMPSPHMKLDSIEYRDGKPVYVYMVYKGTRYYNRKEFEHLIDGALQEAKDLGVESYSYSALERAFAEWKA